MSDVFCDEEPGDEPRQRALEILRPGWYAAQNGSVVEASSRAAQHYRESGIDGDLSPCPLFDPEWYRKCVGNVPVEVPAILHYLSGGWRHGFDPSPLFDSTWYSMQMAVDGYAKSPLEHYLLVGGETGLSPHPLFDPEWYVSELAVEDGSSVPADLTPYEHFLTLGWKSNFDPGPMFDTTKYLVAHRDVASSGLNPFIHFVTQGLADGRSAPPTDRESVASPLQRAVRMFRQSWHSARYPDVGQLPDPLEHFISWGFEEDRSPTILFDPDWYRDKYPNVPTQRPALEHYLLVGHVWGNDPTPMFSSSFYRQQVGEIHPDLSPLEHYLSEGWKTGLDPHPLFSSAWYVERAPDTAAVDAIDGTELTPFEHFLHVGWRLGADAGPLFRTSAYYGLNEDVRDARCQPLEHFLRFGFAERRRASVLIDDSWYRAQAPDDPTQQDMSPLAHFVRFGAPAGRASSADPLASALTSSILAANARARASLTTFEPETGRMCLSIDWEERVRRLVMPRVAQPRVSVVIPTFEHSEDVIRCLESIAAAGDCTSFEIVLVDDASSEVHAQRFDAIDGVRLVRHLENTGFSGACTSGVDASQAEMILLLNNDTEVLPGWLDALVAELDEHPAVGVAGSMVVRPDLRLQEAGCIVWSDGVGHQYGCGDSPLDSRYRTRREVDYCSGASLLVRRSVWDRIDGFDQRFSPAYYEDADLCFAARSLDSTTMYVPGSVVFHNEGSTHGLAGKRLQFRNRVSFAEKWHLELAGQPPSNSGADQTTLIRVRDRRRNGHVLIVDHRIPCPDEDAGSLRMFRIIEDLVTRGLVVHLLTEKRDRSEPWGSRLEAIGVEIRADVGADNASWIGGLAPDLEFVLLSRPEVAGRFQSELLSYAPMVPVAFDMVDAHARRLVRQAAIQGQPALLEDAARLERLEAAAARSADVVVAVSHSDSEFIEQVAGIPLCTAVIPTVHVAEPAVVGFDDRVGLLFVGGFEHRPNVDAALFLALEVLPLIERRIGPVPLTLVGSKVPPEVRRLARNGVTVTGWVADLRPYYARTRLVVAPLRFGAGVKGKIGESLSFGVPTVTTSIGIEGMELRPGFDILVADDAEGLADAVAKTYVDSTSWSSLSENGAGAIEKQFGKAATHDRISVMIDALREADPRRRNPIAKRMGLTDGPAGR